MLKSSHYNKFAKVNQLDWAAQALATLFTMHTFCIKQQQQQQVCLKLIAFGFLCSLAAFFFLDATSIFCSSDFFLHHAAANSVAGMKSSKKDREKERKKRLDCDKRQSLSGRQSRSAPSPALALFFCLHRSLIKQNNQQLKSQQTDE